MTYLLSYPALPYSFIHKKTSNMKPLRFLPSFYLAAVVFLLASCGGSADKTDTTIDSTAATSTTTADATPASTIVNTPQMMVVVTHKVKDYDKWLPSFEAHDSMKLANGIHNYVVGRGKDDANTLVVATKADDVTRAKAFMKDASLKKAMQEGGVTGNPDIRIYEMVYQDTAKVSSTTRTTSTFTVKDWDAWRKSFDSARQAATDNGLALRAYGHEVDDNKKVVVVSAVLDSAKANAFWNSAELKARRTASGAGEIKRFIWEVTKRY